VRRSFSRRVHREMYNLGLTVRLLPPAVQPKGRRGTDAEPFMDPVLGRNVRRDTESRRDLRSQR